MRTTGGDDAGQRERPSFGALDLSALAAAIWRRRLWIAVPTALALVGSAVIVNLTNPTYRSEARILVESGETGYTRAEGDRSGGERAAIDQETVLSQVQLVQSRDIARAVADKLELSRRPEFDPALRAVNPVRQGLMLVGLADNPLRMTAEERVLRSYFEKLAAYQVDKSRIIAVQFESADPRLAAEAANAIAAQLIAAQQTAKRDRTRNAGQWLSGEVETLRKKVEEAEGRVESFRARANLFVGSNNVSLTAQQLAEVNSQIASAKAQQTDAQTRARLLRDFLRSGRPIEAGDIVNSEIIRRLNEQRAAVTAQLAEQSSTLGPRHPRIAELQAQRTNLDSQVRVEAEKLVRVLENDSRLAGARVEALQQNLDQVKRQASEASEQEVQLRVLEREAKSLRDQLEALLGRYRDATVRDTPDALPADARIVSRAVVSNIPAFPKKLPTILITTLGTMLLAFGCVATAALMGVGAPAAARDDEDRVDAGAPMAGDSAPPTAPSFDAEALAGFHVPAGEAEASFAEGPDSIAALAAMLDPAETGGGRTLVVPVTRGYAAVGVAVALGRHVAADGRRAALVDLDAEGRALSALLPPGAAGLGDFAEGRAGFGAILHADPASSAHIVPFGAGAEADPDTADFVVEALARSYDSVVIAAGLLPPEPEAFDRLAALASDAVVVAETSASDPRVVSAFERLRGAGLRPVVVMLAADEAVAAA
ncbi:MAG: lipopolysaccharide biosynthesis protein [Proteobacteria bacterium]|nr:lipopolysaccharide biosynthesis protein [Pseudomonadota bacterium]